MKTFCLREKESSLRDAENNQKIFCRFALDCGVDLARIAARLIGIHPVTIARWESALPVYRTAHHR